MKKNILLLCGGGGPEHEISLVSSKFLEKNLNAIGLYNVIKVEIGKDGIFRKLDLDNKQSEIVEINFKRQLIGSKKEDIHLALPCIHGPPGETGEIQTFFELIKLPYIGCGPEASMVCFNKVTSKLWFNALNIPNTPFEFLSNMEDKNLAHNLFYRLGKVFIKASSQGSSVGCYQVVNKDQLDHALVEAFKYSNYVLAEQMVNARELEISVYEFNNKLITTVPGEINCPSKFYSYEEKYNPDSKTTTEIVAPNLSNETIEKMKSYALKAFTHLKLRHLARIDFFYTDKGEIFLNEINTFPGMTPISMFPKMMENNGHSFNTFLKDIISNTISK